MGLLHVHDHVQLPVAVYVPETEGDGCEVLSISNQGRHKIYLGFCCVSPWKLDDLYVPVDIDSDKVTWMGRTISMTHNHIRLIGSGSAIVQVVLIGAPPVQQKRHHDETREHRHHYEPNRKYPMDTPWSWLLRLGCVSWRLVGDVWWGFTKRIFSLPVSTVDHWRIAFCGYSLVADRAIGNRGRPTIIIIVVVPRVKTIRRRTRTRNNRVFCRYLPLVHFSPSRFLSSMRSAASRNVIMPSTM